MTTATALRPACGRCHHQHADHVDWDLAPQCASKGCACLQYRPPGMVPASRAASAVTPMRAHTPPAAPKPAAAERTAGPVRPPEFTEPADEELTIEQLLERGRASELAAIVKLADKVTGLLDDLRERLADEAAADGVKRLVADLEKRLADARGKLRDVGRGRRKTPPRRGISAPGNRGRARLHPPGLRPDVHDLAGTRPARAPRTRRVQPRRPQGRVTAS